MELFSPMNPKEYLTALSDTMGSFSAFGDERFTGFTVGKWFYVTHHAGYEWNRKYTNQKNAALGYVEQTHDGSRVRFVCFKGALCPAQFLFLWTVVVAFYAIALLAAGILLPEAFVLAIALITVVIVVSALIGTFFESLTERSEEGRRCLIAHLLDPADPFSYLNHKDKIP